MGGRHLFKIKETSKGDGTGFGFGQD